MSNAEKKRLIYFGTEYLVLLAAGSIELQTYDLPKVLLVCSIQRRTAQGSILTRHDQTGYVEHQGPPSPGTWLTL